MSRRIALAVLGALTLTAPVLVAAPASAGGSCHEPARSLVGTEVGMTEGCFTPSVLQVRPGRTVAFRNPSKAMHTVSTTGGEFGAEVAPGEALQIRFDEAGVFPYFCHYHPGMVGAIVVTDVTPSDLASSAGGGGGPSAGVAAVVAGGLGIGAGLVLGGRLRVPARSRERALAG